MKIQQVHFVNNPAAKLTFNSLHVVDTEVQQLLLTNLKEDQLVRVSEIIKEQKNNSVHIILDSEDGKKLKASLLCQYRLQDFKTKYKQFPIFESKFGFIKRIAKIANKYQKQIDNFEVIPLKWTYFSLTEWTSKMHL